MKIIKILTFKELVVTKINDIAAHRAGHNLVIEYFNTIFGKYTIFFKLSQIQKCYKKCLSKRYRELQKKKKKKSIYRIPLKLLLIFLKYYGANSFDNRHSIWLMCFCATFDTC